jgi:hypothetical protein
VVIIGIDRAICLKEDAKMLIFLDIALVLSEYVAEYPP